MIARFAGKPVSVNDNNFRNRKLGNFLVSIAGISMEYIDCNRHLYIPAL